MYGIVISGFDSELRDRLINDLAHEGIETRPFFSPLHRQQVLRDKSRACTEITVAIDIADRGLYLPSGPRLCAEDRVRVAETMIKLIGQYTLNEISL